MKEQILSSYNKSYKKYWIVQIAFIMLSIFLICFIVADYFNNYYVTFISLIVLPVIIFWFSFFLNKFSNKPFMEFKKYCSGLSTGELNLAKLKFENMQNNDTFFDFKQIIYAVSMSILLSLFYDGIKPQILNANAKTTKFFIVSVILLIVFLTLTFFIYKNSIRNKNILSVINDILIERLNEKKSENK